MGTCVYATWPFFGSRDGPSRFRQKYKSFMEQYELRELQFHSLLRTKEIEVQYQSARFEQQKKAQEQEAGRCRQLTAQVSTFSHTENELRNQLNVYVEKFKQVCSGFLVLAFDFLRSGLSRRLTLSARSTYRCSSDFWSCIDVKRCEL